MRAAESGVDGKAAGEFNPVRPNMKRLFPIGKVAKASLLAAVMVPVVSAQSVFEFNFDGVEGQTTFVNNMNVSGIDLTMTLTNPVLLGGDYSQVFWSYNFDGFDDLVLAPAGESGGVATFDFQFSRDVTITAYTVTYVDDWDYLAPITGASFSLSSISAAASTGNLIDTVSPQGQNETYLFINLTTPFVLPANEVGTLTVMFPENSKGYAALGRLSVTAVPEPGTWALMGGGLASLVFIRWRRRRKPT